MKTNLLLIELKEKQIDYQIESFVMDFLEFWSFIHEQAPKHSLDTAYDFLQSIWDSHTLPFYQKYKKSETLELYEAWVASSASFAIAWGTRGHTTFPLELLIYEIHNWQKGLLNEIIQNFCTKKVLEHRKVLFDTLIPTLVNHVVPLSDTDILLLKVKQVVLKMSQNDYREPSKRKLASFANISLKTIERRLKVFQLLRISDRIPRLDYAKLGFETYLMIHHNSYPEELKKYLHYSIEFPVGTISLVHIPIKKQELLIQLNKLLNPVIIRNMEQHKISWNLTQIQSGSERWKRILPTIDPRNAIISSSPDLELDLLPRMELFRKLTEVDFKILDFLGKGTFDSITEFSKTIGVSRNELSKRLEDYKNHKILNWVICYYNIGLTTLWVYISDPANLNGWYPQLSQLPFSELYLARDEPPFVCFGAVKIPPNWITQFSRKMDLLKQEIRFTFLFKPSSMVDFYRNAGVSLAETYPQEGRKL